jgi:general secretion pathway protein H
MRTLAPGSPEAVTLRQCGFTLLELLLVVSLIALATAAVSLAIPDPAATQLEREAQRVSALLEAGRAQARTTGVAVIWRADGQGFVIDQVRRPWLAAGTQVRLTRRGQPTGSTQLALGPEPLMAAHELALTLSNRTVWLGTDGLRPFAVLAEPPAMVLP